MLYKHRTVLTRRKRTQLLWCTGTFQWVA